MDLRTSLMHPARIISGNPRFRSVYQVISYDSDWHGETIVPQSTPTNPEDTMYAARNLEGALQSLGVQAKWFDLGRGSDKKHYLVVDDHPSPAPGKPHPEPGVYAFFHPTFKNRMDETQLSQQATPLRFIWTPARKTGYWAEGFNPFRMREQGPRFLKTQAVIPEDGPSMPQDTWIGDPKRRIFCKGLSPKALPVPGATDATPNNG